MVERIIRNRWLVLVVLVHDIYNVMETLMGADVVVPEYDWFGLGIKVFLCLVIIALLKHVQRLEDMLAVHRAVSLYRNRNLLLHQVDADEVDEAEMMNRALKREIGEVRRYLIERHPEKKGREIDEMLEAYYRGKR